MRVGIVASEIWGIPTVFDSSEKSRLIVPNAVQMKPGNRRNAVFLESTMLKSCLALALAVTLAPTATEARWTGNVLVQNLMANHTLNFLVSPTPPRPPAAPQLFPALEGRFPSSLRHSPPPGPGRPAAHEWRWLLGGISSCWIVPRTHRAVPGGREGGGQGLGGRGWQMFALLHEIISADHA